MALAAREPLFVSSLVTVLPPASWTFRCACADSLCSQSLRRTPDEISRTPSLHSSLLPVSVPQTLAASVFLNTHLCHLNWVLSSPCATSSVPLSPSSHNILLCWGLDQFVHQAPACLVVV